MTSDDHGKQPFPSTRYAYKRVIIRTSAAGTSTARRSRSGFRRLPIADRARSVTLTVKYLPGAESWWLVKARGECERLPGYLTLDDVMKRVLSEG